MFNINICVVNVNRTSCGACAEHCPVQAIHIEGNPIHLEAKAPKQETVIETQDFDFGF